MTAPTYTIKINRAQLLTYLIGAAGLFAVIGALAPWVTLTAPFVGSISKNGTSGDGVFVVILGVALLAVAGLRIGGVRVHWAVALVLALALLGLAVYEIVRVYQAAGELRTSLAGQDDDPLGLSAAVASASSLSVGFGLWLDGVAGIVGLGAAIALASAPQPQAAAGQLPPWTPGAPQGWPAQPYPAQPYPAQPYPAQQYPAQPYPAQQPPPAPDWSYPQQTYPGQSQPAYPQSPYPSPDYPAPDYPPPPYR
jgi:predicted small integral membrane protein